jgi:rubrerythrin
MYPEFHAQAVKEGDIIAAGVAMEQMSESKEHAEEFIEILKKAEKRFNALKKIEKRHAEAYQQKLETL